MAERVLVLHMPRALWIGGLVLSAVSVVVSLVVSHPAPLIGLFGLVFAVSPLLARLDAVKLNGPYLSVRKAIRWVGPVDLRTLVALSYLSKTARRPAVWLMVQREAGARFRWYWRLCVERDTRTRTAGQRDLRVIEVAAGGALSQLPGLADHIANYVLPSEALVDQRAHAALQRLRG